MPYLEEELFRLGVPMGATKRKRNWTAEQLTIVWVVVLTVAIVVFAVGMWVFTSAMESAAYNRLTGAKTTTWDAMWVQLRVQEAPRK